MTGKHDPSWLSNPKLGVNDYNELSRRQQDDTKLPRDPAESVNLIDYCYIHEWKEIIEKNWNNTPDNIFQSKDRTLQMLEILSGYRNRIICMGGIIPYYHINSIFAWA
jgi:hypothetical protein